MDEHSGQTVRRLTEEYGSWFLRDDYLEMGRLSGRLHPFERPFSPIRIDGVTLKNRIAMAPMGNLSAAEESGRPSDRMVRYFAELARGGAGLLVSGLVPVGQKVDPTVTEPGGLTCFPRLDRSRSVFAGWRDIAGACHAFGARFFVQLSAGAGRVGSPECVLNGMSHPGSTTSVTPSPSAACSMPCGWGSLSAGRYEASPFDQALHEGRHRYGPS